MSPCDASRTLESAQVTIGERTEAVTACKTVGSVGGRAHARTWWSGRARYVPELRSQDGTVPVETDDD